MTQVAEALAPPARPTRSDYVVVYSVIIASSVLVVRMLQGSAEPSAARALVPPLFAMLGLTGVVWLAMALLRNLMVMLGKASMRYYHRYVEEAPPEWIERPGRTFNNLMEVPLVFYAVCLVPMALNEVDTVQVQLAWLFVGCRVIHAFIMLAWNFVPYRFAAYIAGCLALVALAVQVAQRCWPA